jgi:hypothetical protein
MLLLTEGEEQVAERVSADGELEVRVARKGMKKSVVDEEMLQLQRRRDVALGKMLRFRVRYFSDGVVIGTREFVNEVFAKTREGFGPDRKDGARKMRGDAAAAAGVLWSMRDLKA